jgi:hypothetical protein
MEMIDGLAAVFARVDDDAVALGEIFLAGDFCRSPEQVSEKRGVMRPGFGERDDVFARHNQDVDRSFGPDISEGVAFVVLKNRRGGDASFNDFAEEAVHDGISVQEVIGAAARAEVCREFGVQSDKWRRRVELETYTILAVFQMLCRTR